MCLEAVRASPSKGREGTASTHTFAIRNKVYPISPCPEFIYLNRTYKIVIIVYMNKEFLELDSIGKIRAN